MERNTANDYMAYLASSIAQIEDHGFTAITDHRENLSPLLKPEDQTNIELDDLRLNLLRKALPAPVGILTAQEIQIFKKRHGSLLPDFRFWLEQRIAQIADSNSDAVRQKRLIDTQAEISYKTEEIRKTLRKHGWTNVVFDDLFSVLGLLPGIEKISKLVQAIYRGLNTPPKSGPLAYAAFAQDELALDA